MMRSSIKVASILHLADSGLDPMTRYVACKGMAKGYADTIRDESERLDHARLYCTAIVKAFWLEVCNKHNHFFSLPTASAKISIKTNDLPVEVLRVAESTGKIIASLKTSDSAFLIGSIYTLMMPNQLRSQMGAYHTPPPLVERLIDMAVNAGFNLSKDKIIDPACGGGAFLVPIALRMLSCEAKSAPKFVFKRLMARLKGVELDPFSAWVAKVSLESALLPICISAGTRLPDDIIVCGNTLDVVDSEIHGYDLVIGNPPYGRVTLSKEMREKFSRSLYGHANLYGLFTDLALRLVKPNGVIAYLTPTSFLGGKYFLNLRKLLSEKATLSAIDFVSDRDDVFEGVLQETTLTAFKVDNFSLLTVVSNLIPKGMHSAVLEKVAQIKISVGADPWVIPRSSADKKILAVTSKMPTRLIDLGYQVSTGQLVWNRFKSQLRMKTTSKSLPLIWAESVGGDGFKFSSDKRNHAPYFEPLKRQDFLITRSSCVLVQRTTSVEQERRIVTAVLPQSFIDQYGGVIVENHLNIVYSDGFFTYVSPEVIHALLNTKTIDQIFRCISGSVAVSAYELNNLPLPSKSQMATLAKALLRGASKEFIEKKVASFYGV
jgi:tRNA1(Val) A37 N6-methylase TrmN6